MAKVCALCGKGPKAGRSIARRGMAKKKGGAGRKITGISKRKFRPNLQKKKVLVDGAPKVLLVCTKCIKAGKIERV